MKKLQSTMKLESRPGALWGLVVFILMAVPIVTAQQNSSGNSPQAQNQATKSSADANQIIVDTDLVTLNVTVIDSEGFAITGLEKKNFAITDNKHPQEITFFSDADLPLSVGIVFDLSGSMSGKKIARAREALATFMQTSHPDDEFFLIGFNSQPQLLRDRTRDSDAVIKKLSLVEPEGATALYDAAYLALERVAHGSYTKRAILIISDGEDNNSRYSLSELRRSLKESGVSIYAVLMHGFLNKFEMMQGLLNFGGATNFAQLRFGQIFNLRNAGFAGTDRGLTETLPFIFQPVNGFNSSGLGRGVSGEYTLSGTTTFKAFANSNEPVEIETEEGGPVVEVRRSRTYGFIYEQVLGKKGLSGVQFQFAGGRTPLFINGVREPSLRFQRFSFFANKTFQDRRNFERVNAIFGISLLRDNRFLEADIEQRSRGYGYFLELDTIPVARHLSIFGRYDQLRPTTLLTGNTFHGGTLGVIYDPIKYARVSFEYQRLDLLETVNRYRIGFQLNF